MIPKDKLAIADRGYEKKAYDNMLSTPNPFDDPDVKKLKKRARSRQESFNSRLKNFKILDYPFRGKDKLEQHRTAFEATTVICQTQLDCGSVLFDV